MIKNVGGELVACKVGCVLVQSSGAGKRDLQYTKETYYM